MISEEKKQAEPLFVSLCGHLIEDESWMIFDHYQFVGSQLFLIGLTLDGVEKRVLFEQARFTDENLEYSMAFLESKMNGLTEALSALTKIKNEKRI